MCALESRVFIILLHTVCAPKSKGVEMRGEERRAEMGKYRSEISDNKAISHMVSCEMAVEF